MQSLQKIATRIFMGASVVFGILGFVIVFTCVGNPNVGSTFSTWLLKSFMLSVLTILPSFALSVAGKYLSSK